VTLALASRRTTPEGASANECSGLRLVPREASSPSPISDEQVIDAVQRGDDRVARLLYDRLYAVVDRTLFRVFGRRENDHDDLVQAVFEQIVITLTRRSYARGCNLKTWAASIAHHVASTALRSRRRERRVVDRGASIESLQALPRANAEAMTVARIELGHVREHLLAMKPKHAEAVFFHDVLGHPLAEVAELTHVSVSAATSRLVRGRRELYRRLDAELAS
jgi:RNA polymerase sigma factor (sigma-70 family)